MSQEMFSLKDRVAIITGGSRGIGRAIALGFAGAGAKVVVSSRTAATVAAVVKEIRDAGGEALGIVADVSKSADAERLVKETLAAFGKIDILVNNAGISAIYKRAEKITEAEWNEILATNLNGTFFCAQAAGRVMIEQKRGNIINIVTMGAEVGLPRLAAYCASKGGVEQLTKTLALEWAPHNIRVNAIGPAFVETDLTKAIQVTPHLLEPLVQQTPLKRLAKPEEMVGAAVYLASNASSYVTGQTIFVDGGWTAA